MANRGRGSNNGLAMQPRQAAAICYRNVGDRIEFLLVGTNGNKWTFPKGFIDGDGERATALREALEEAGAVGDMAEQSFCAYLHAKGVFWKKNELREFRVKAYLMKVLFTVPPAEELRNPTWFTASEAKEMLAAGREVKYRREFEQVIDQAVEQIERLAKAAADRRAG